MAVPVCRLRLTPVFRWSIAGLWVVDGRVIMSYVSATSQIWALEHEGTWVVYWRANQPGPQVTFEREVVGKFWKHFLQPHRHPQKPRMYA